MESKDIHFIWEKVSRFGSTEKLFLLSTRIKSQNDLLFIQPWHSKRKRFLNVICAVVRVALTNESMTRLTYSWN